MTEGHHLRNKPYRHRHARVAHERLLRICFGNYTIHRFTFPVVLFFQLARTVGLPDIHSWHVRSQLDPWAGRAQQNNV